MAASKDPPKKKSRFTGLERIIDDINRIALPKILGEQHGVGFYEQAVRTGISPSNLMGMVLQFVQEGGLVSPDFGPINPKRVPGSREHPGLDLRTEAPIEMPFGAGPRLDVPIPRVEVEPERLESLPRPARKPRV